MWFCAILKGLFEAHQLTPPSSSPPVGESLFIMRHALKLTKLLLPLPPFQLVSPHLWCAMFWSSPTHSSLFIPSSCWVLICEWCWYAKPWLYMLAHGLDVSWVHCGLGCNQSDVHTCTQARFRHMGQRGNWTKTLKELNCWPLICHQVPCFGTEIHDTPQHANEREQEREMKQDMNEVPWALGNGLLWLWDWTAQVRLVLLLGGGNCSLKLSTEVWDLVTLPGGSFSC